MPARAGGGEGGGYGDEEKKSSQQAKVEEERNEEGALASAGREYSPAFGGGCFFPCSPRTYCTTGRYEMSVTVM